MIASSPISTPCKMVTCAPILAPLRMVTGNEDVEIYCFLSGSFLHLYESRSLPYEKSQHDFRWQCDPVNLETTRGLDNNHFRQRCEHKKGVLLRCCGFPKGLEITLEHQLARQNTLCWVTRTPNVWQISNVPFVLLGINYQNLICPLNGLQSLANWIGTVISGQQHWYGFLVYHHHPLVMCEWLRR